jgi:hypothetical protein
MRAFGFCHMCLAARARELAVAVLEIRVLWIIQTGSQRQFGARLPTAENYSYEKVASRPHRGRIIGNCTGCSFGSIPGRESTPQVRGDSCRGRRNRPASRAGFGVTRPGVCPAIDSRCSRRGQHLPVESGRYCAEICRWAATSGLDYSLPDPWTIHQG